MVDKGRGDGRMEGEGRWGSWDGEGNQHMEGGLNNHGSTIDG